MTVGKSRALSPKEKKAGRRRSLRRNRAAYLIFFGLMGLLYYWIRSAELGVMFFALLILPVLSYIFAWFSRRGVRITQRAEGGALQKGGRGTISVTLENKGWLPVPYVSFRFPDDAGGLIYPERPGVYSLPAGGRRELSFSALPRYRGDYAAGVSEAYVEDFLRIFRLSCPAPQQVDLLVYPAVRPLPGGMQLTALTDHTTPQPGAVEDYSSVADIVPYDPSQEFRKVHWKLTARLDELMVRRFDTEDVARTVLLLDMSANGEGEAAAAAADAMTEAAVSVLSAWMKDEQPAALVYGVERPLVIQRSGREGFAGFHRLLAGLPNTTPYTAAQLLRFYLEGTHGGTAVAVLTGRVDDELLAAVSQSLNAGVQVCIFYMQQAAADGGTEGLLRDLEQRGIPVRRFRLGEDGPADGGTSL